MSETETNTGKLKPAVLIAGETNEDFAKRFLGGKKEDYNETYLEQLLEDGYMEWVMHNGVLYSVKNERDADDGDIFNATLNPDGTISFVLRYYNGGCSFNDAIEEALKRMK